MGGCLLSSRQTLPALGLITPDGSRGAADAPTPEEKSWIKEAPSGGGLGHGGAGGVGFWSGNQEMLDFIPLSNLGDPTKLQQKINANVLASR